ncbi:phosphodiester glycosidase family protein [Niabella hirudinis]|uniref:phosphodiester glycosidase family protein n=1 Tax=Niabella hirudinis TaxID=1285929 RepID=UPI003EB748D5
MKTWGNCRLLLLLTVIFISCNKDFKDDEQGLVEGANSPSISGLSKTSGVMGDTLTIMGDFPNGGEVTFGIQKLNIVSFNSKEIVVVVPYGTGSAFVMVNSGVLRSNKVTFTYTLPPAKEGVRIGDNYYDVDTTTIMEVGPGTKYMVLSFTDRYTTNHLKVHLTFMDTQNPLLSFKPALARDTVASMDNIPNIAVRKSKAGARYFVGVNGDLFNTTLTAPPGVNNQGRVNNSCIVDGLITNMSYNYPAYAPVYFNGNTVYFDDFEFVSYVQVPDMEKIGIKNVNNSRAADDLILYNTAKGRHTNTNNFGTEMAVVPIGGSWGDYTNVRVKINTKVVYGQVGSTVIPAGGAVVSGHDFSATVLNTASIGDTLTIVNYAKNTATGTLIQQMISGDRRILQNGQVINPVAARTARTAIGASADKSTLVFCVAEGAIAGVSVGISTSDLAEILKMYGIADAVHMNGGNYSTLYVKGAGYNNGGLVNRPNNTTTASSVGNGLFAISKAPDDASVVKLVSDLYSVRVKAGGTITPRFYGLNKYGHIVNSDISGVTVTEANGLGTVTGTSFTAGTTTGYTELVGTYGGMTSKVMVNIVP